MAEGKSTRLDEHQRSRNPPPKSKKKVSLPYCSRSGLQRLRMFAFFFFLIFARISGAGWTFWEPFFLTFRRVGGSETGFHSVHLVHRHLERSILPSKLAKNEIWRRNDWEPMAQFVVEWRIVAGGLCTWRWQFFVMDREKCLWGCVTKMCTLKKKSFWWTAEERRVLPVKGIRLQSFCAKMTAKDCM